MKTKLVTVNAIIIILLGIVHLSPAQKVDLDKYLFQDNFRSWPTHYLGNEYLSYNVTSSTEGKSTTYFKEETIKKSIHLDLWTRIERTGDISFDILFEDFYILEPRVVSRRKPVQNKDQKPVDEFAVELQMTFRATCKVVDQIKKELLDERLFKSRNDTIRHLHPNYYSQRNQALSEFNNVKEQLIKDQITLHGNNVLKNISEYYNRRFGFRTEARNYVLWLLDNKKHPEHIAQQEIWNLIKPDIKTVNKNGLSDEAKEHLSKAIEYFTDVKKRFPDDSKDHKKLRYGAFYNSAKIYQILEMPDEAEDEILGLENNDYDVKDAKQLRKEVEKLNEQLLKSEAGTRRFTRNLDQIVDRGEFNRSSLDLVAPTKVKSAEKPLEIYQFTTESTITTTDKKQISGKVDMVFKPGEDGILMWINVKEDNGVTQAITSSKVESVKVGDKAFLVVMMEDKIPVLFEVLKKTPKAALLQHWERTGPIEYGYTVYFNKKRVHTSSYYLINRALSKIFKDDCPKVVEMAKKRHYKHSVESLSELVDHLTECGS